ncbi:MAG: threonine synthase [Planctomycetota bacterium]|jgi:threonine synthase
MSITQTTTSLLTHLECGACDTSHDAFAVHNVCVECGGPLLARYDLSDDTPSLQEVLTRPPGQNRVPEVGPCQAGAQTPSLGEGATPIVPAGRLADALGLPALWIKDEAQNPTASFKARGMAAALGRAAELGISAVCLPSAGNAGGAAAAFGALHGLDVHVFVPESTPSPIIEETRALGAHVELVPGSIADAGSLLAKVAAEQGWFSLATLKEPYRLEGKKVMGYELLYDFGSLPDVILYPTGGGTGLIGMWKAFDEMEQMGWIGSERPRMVSVQSAGCAPIVRAFEEGLDHAPHWADPERTEAFGLRVPGALGDFLILRALRESSGTALAIGEADLIRETRAMGRMLGLQCSPEGGACVAAAKQLVERGWLQPEERVVLFNTGHGLKYGPLPAQAE